MLNLNSIHHVAIICSNYAASKKFYTEILGLSIVAEHYRDERNSYKLDLQLNGRYIIELFSFPDPPARQTNPESTGLRHLAFELSDIENATATLTEHGVKFEPLRTDPLRESALHFFVIPMVYR
jgi:glyoxylase I family protein